MPKPALSFTELPYRPDSCAWFERIRQLPAPLFLDSCYPHSRAGRFDILTADPLETCELSPGSAGSYEDVSRYFDELLERHRQACEGVVGAP